MNKPREKTSDWILTEGYVQDDEPCKHENKNIASTGYIVCFDCLQTFGVECKHGVYRLIAPHTIICSICEQVIMPPKQVEEVGDWINDLCRGA